MASTRVCTWRAPSTRRAGAVLLFSASLWGVAWWPLQQLARAGVQGPALAIMAYGAVGCAGLPLLWRERRHWRGQEGLLALLGLLGGWANAAFVVAFSEGDAVREMLLFYLAPAWSVLGAKFLLHERLPARRLGAAALGITGAFLVIRASGPINTGSITLPDIFALTSGIAFAGSNLATRYARKIPVASKSVAAILACALLSCLTLAGLGYGLAAPSMATALGVVAFALVWIVVGTSTTSYAVTHLEAGRASLLILSELVAAALSASIVQQRIPAMLEIVGAILIVAASVLAIVDRPAPSDPQG